MVSSLQDAKRLHKQGNLEEAESLYRQVLARRENVVGHKHTDISTLSMMNTLAFVLQNRGKLEEVQTSRLRFLEHAHYAL